jgi:thiamine-phosphate pyrophosphorylase
MSHVNFSLYLITDRHQTGGRPLLPLLDGAMNGGVKAIQLREKELDTRSLLHLANDVLAIVRKHGGQLLINDRTDLVMALGADGVHLRADSMPVAAARRLLGPDRLIGVSVHSADEVRQAESDGADFVVLGPIYDTPSKRAYGSPLGLRPLEQVRLESNMPIFVIGGITQKRVSDVRRAGAFGVAVVSAILAADNVEIAARGLLDELESCGAAIRARKA